MLYSKSPTHIVLVGYFSNFNMWNTEFCVPFFNEESAIGYRDDMIRNNANTSLHYVVLPYTP